MNCDDLSLMGIGAACVGGGWRTNANGFVECLRNGAPDRNGKERRVSEGIVRLMKGERE